MVTAIIQARLGSTRLPGKIFSELAGKALLELICERLSFSRRIEGLVVATTISQTDDLLEKWCMNRQIKCFRGSENDVLGRFYHAAVSAGTSVVVRITSDDPFKDPFITDKVIEYLESNRLDFACNNNPPTFPEGLDTEVFTFNALQTAHLESIDPFEREHVTQYFYRHPGKFKSGNVSSQTNLSHLRWTIDTIKDLEMARTVYDRLYKPGSIFKFEDIIGLLDEDPGIALINSDVERSHLYKR